MSEFARYARQVVLAEVGVQGQAVLRDSCALVLGLGGLGSAAAAYLAGAGVGDLIVIDRDRVELSNLQRQTLYAQADLGQPKAQAAAARLRAMNPDLRVRAQALAPEGAQLAALVQEADVVLDCTDNFPSRFALNRACARARKPLVSGAAIRFEAQLAVFDLRAGGPCYACLYPEAGETQERCEDAGVLGPVAGFAGALQALAALKLLLGLPANAGQLLMWNAADMRQTMRAIPKDPACPVCAA